ncbi:MAG: rod shape-determining protein MreD [Hyphomicrobium sp.]|uniref:rod shape-determining protein MreD n=1 Tax=Hyphomicrobium sp. TaxID=82 RepID=UPI0039E52E3D
MRLLTPILSVAALTIVAVLPWGLPTDDRFVLPLLPIVAIIYWTLDRDAWLPEWAIFLAGLMLDALTQGPLGYWALVYLIAYVVAVYCSNIRVETTAGQLGLFAGAIVAVTVFAWLAASIYFLELLAWEPYALGAAFALFGATALALVRGFFKSSGSPVRPARLTRGD